jgi:hypothetical protein
MKLLSKSELKRIAHQTGKQPPEYEFCIFCGAGIGIHRREGEGTCYKCDPPLDKGPKT